MIHIYIDLDIHSGSTSWRNQELRCWRSQKKSLRQILYGGCRFHVDAARSVGEFLYSSSERTLAGATTITSPDTVGYMTPSEFQTWFWELKKTSPTWDVQLFPYTVTNDLGLAVANFEAVKNGAAVMYHQRHWRSGLETPTRRVVMALHVGVSI